jgi:hypothetical protein
LVTDILDAGLVLARDTLPVPDTLSLGTWI